MSELSCELRDAVMRLHRRKDAIYGNAWKKRGELLSIVANLARKADRLENFREVERRNDDETVLDTVVDLLVYAAKYKVYLEALPVTDKKSELFDGGRRIAVVRTASAELARTEEIINDAFERNWPLHAGQLDESIASTHASFGDLETAYDFALSKIVAPIGKRVEFVDSLVRAAIALLASVAVHAPHSVTKFITENG